MCNRTQEEILARELMYQRGLGVASNCRTYADNNYKVMLKHSRKLLDTLLNHNRESKDV